MTVDGNFIVIRSEEMPNGRFVMTVVDPDTLHISRIVGPHPIESRTYVWWVYDGRTGEYSYYVKSEQMSREECIELLKKLV